MVRGNFSVARESQSVSEPVPGRLQRRMGGYPSTAYRGVERRATIVAKEGSMTVPSSERQRVVWIINEGGHPYEKGKKFGRLVPLTIGNVNHFNLDRLMVSIAPRLRSATAEDYLLISGSPILNALVVSLWLARFSKANLLQWSVKADDYVCIPLHAEAVTRMATQHPADQRVPA